MKLLTRETRPEISASVHHVSSQFSLFLRLRFLAQDTCFTSVPPIYLHAYMCRENPDGDPSLGETTLKPEGRIKIKDIVTCKEVHATKMPGFISDDWIY
jgi:hypothetical protein